VNKDDGSTRIFKQSEHGLYYYDMNLTRESTLQGHGPSKGGGSSIIFNIVAENIQLVIISIQRRLVQFRGELEGQVPRGTWN
jgi:hypothetical protein